MPSHNALVPPNCGSCVNQHRVTGAMCVSYATRRSRAPRSSNHPTATRRADRPARAMAKNRSPVKQRANNAERAHRCSTCGEIGHRAAHDQQVPSRIERRLARGADGLPISRQRAAFGKPCHQAVLENVAAFRGGFAARVASPRTQANLQAPVKPRQSELPSHASFLWRAEPTARVGNKREDAVVYVAPPCGFSHGEEETCHVGASKHQPCRSAHWRSSRTYASARQAWSWPDKPHRR